MGDDARPERLIELDDDARHECDENQWGEDTRNLLWLLSGFIYLHVRGIEPGGPDLDKRFKELDLSSRKAGYRVRTR